MVCLTQPSPTRPSKRQAGSTCSTVSPPTTAPARPICTSRVPSPTLTLADYESDADESGSESDALTQLQSYTSGSDEEDAGDEASDVDEAYREGTASRNGVAIASDASGLPLTEDDAYLRDLSRSIQKVLRLLASADPDVPIIKQCKGLGDDVNAIFFVHLLEPALRSELRSREFPEFVRNDQRNVVDTDKRRLKSFFRLRARKLTDMFELYVYTMQAAGCNDELLNAFEILLAELMDCFDHPNEVVVWNPFSAMAALVQAGAVARTPKAVQSCSRLTLGADWGLLSEQDERRIGVGIMLRLYRLHFWRKCEIDELLGRWSDKFRIESTCPACNTDPWEIFLLTTVLSMIKEGTRYVDEETASDTSSEGEDERSKQSVDPDNLACGNCSDDNDDEGDDHQGLFSDSDVDMASDLGDRLDQQPVYIDDTQEPPRRNTSGFQCRQRLLRNYGPNAYVLRIVHIKEIGSGNFAKATMRVCPHCGHRFDGNVPERTSRFFRDLERAISVAREQISALPEVIDLSDV